MRGHRDDLHVEATKVPGNGHAPKRMDAAQNDRDVAVEGERAIDFPARMSSGLDRVGLGEVLRRPGGGRNNVMEVGMGISQNQPLKTAMRVSVASLGLPEKLKRVEMSHLIVV